MKNGISIFFALVLLSCNGTDENKTIVNSPPYNVLTDSIQQQPQNAQLYYRRGGLLYQNGQLATATQDLQKAWELQPTEEHALSVVTVLIKTSPDSALLFIQHALPQLPKSIALQLALARGYQQKKEAQKAVTVCDQVLLIYPSSLDALLLKAELLKQQNNDTAALAALEQAYSYAPFDAELCYNLAFEYAQAKNARVLPLTDSLIHADSMGKQAQPYYLKGVYYANTGYNAKAVAFYNQAIAHDYTFFDAYMDKGALLYDEKKYEAALQIFTLVSRITPTYAESYYWSGKCKEALGQKADAKLDYQRAYSLDKTATDARDAAAKL